MTRSLDVSLYVALKGADPVVSTAYLTLVGKMGYEGKLLALSRLGSYVFSVECEDPAATVERLKRLLATQSTFYNRNKHNYFLDCRWNGERYSDGVPLDDLLAAALRPLTSPKHDKSQDFDSQQAENRVILSNVPAFLSGVVVEDTDPEAGASVAAMLEAGLGAHRVIVRELGIRWYLALRAGTKEEAKELTEHIVVTESRDRGLLLNPNYQRYNLLSLNEIKAELT